MSLVFLLGKLEYIFITARIKFKFSIFAFSIGYKGILGNGGVWRPTSIFFKGHTVQEGSSGTGFDHGLFEIKTFPIYALPY